MMPRNYQTPLPPPPPPQAGFGMYPQQPLSLKMLCCGSCRNPDYPPRVQTQILDQTNFLYQQQQQQQQQQQLVAAQAQQQLQQQQQQLQLQQQQQQQQAQVQQQAQQQQNAAAVAAAAAGQVGPKSQQPQITVNPTTHVPGGGQQRYVGGVNYLMQNPAYQNALQLASMQNSSSTALFTKPILPGQSLYSNSMIFDRTGSRLCGPNPQDHIVSLQPESSRKVSGLSREVFYQIHAVEAEFDVSSLPPQYAEMERRGEMIIRILNPASLNPAWVDETCRRYGDGFQLPSWIQFVEIIKRPGETLGFYIREGDGIYSQEGVYISRVALESAVYQSGCLRVGDEILSVNMVDVQRMSLDDLVIILSTPKRLVLTIRSRPLNSTVEHLLPGGRMYGSESYYDTVPSDIYNRVDDLRSKPVVVLKQNLEDIDDEEEDEALAAATAAAEAGLIGVEEIEILAAEIPVSRASRSGSMMDIYDELKSRSLVGGGMARSASLIGGRRQLFANTGDNFADLAVADAALAFARRRAGSLTGIHSILDRPSSRLSALGLPATPGGAVKVGGKKSLPAGGSSLYHGRLSNRSRSSTGRLTRTASDMMLGGFDPESLLDPRLQQIAAQRRANSRRHSLTNGNDFDDQQIDYFLQRYNTLRNSMRGGQRFGSLDRSKTPLRNSFSSQAISGPLGTSQRRLELLSQQRARKGSSNYSDFDTASLYEQLGRAVTPNMFGGSGSQTNSLPRGASLYGSRLSSAGGSRPTALNQRLAQLEDYYAKKHGLSPRPSPGRPHSALGNAYSDLDSGDQEQLAKMRRNLGLRYLQRQQQQNQRNASSDSPSNSALYETIRQRGKDSQHSSLAGLDILEGDEMTPTGLKQTSQKPAYYPDEKTREINRELRDRFASRQSLEEERMKEEFDQVLQSSGSSNAVGGIGNTVSSARMLHIDPSGFQQYGPEMRTQHPHRLNEEGTQGFSGVLVIHLLGVRGLHVASGTESGAPPTVGVTRETEKNLYCVVECDRIYKARTVAVSSHSNNGTNFDWDEIFDIDMFDTKEVTFLFYTWNPTSRHKLCSKGTIHLPWISTLRSQHVHAFEMRLYETPGAMLYIKLEYHDLTSTFKRVRRDLSTFNSKSSSKRHDNLQPVFGVDIDTIVQREASGFGVPVILKRCTEEVEQRGAHLVGIYRLCGSAIRKKHLREQFEKNPWMVDLGAESVPDINVITSLLKDYLRELPEPLFNKALFDMMDDGLSVCVPEDPTGNAKLMFSILECLSKSQRSTVLFLMDHIKLIHLNADRNKMTSQSLAICFGPLFSCHVDSESVHKSIQVFKFLLDIWPSRKGAFNFMEKNIRTDKSSLSNIGTNMSSQMSAAQQQQQHQQQQSQSQTHPTSVISTLVELPPKSSSVSSSSYLNSATTGPLSNRYSSTSRDRDLSASSYDTDRYKSTTSAVPSSSYREKSKDTDLSSSSVSRYSKSNTDLYLDNEPMIVQSGNSKMQISERNPFRSLVKSMSQSLAEADKELEQFGTASNSSVTSFSPSGGRQLPSTQSATRTISVYSSSNSVLSQVKVPAGSTGPSVINSGDSSSRYRSSDLFGNTANQSANSSSYTGRYSSGLESSTGSATAASSASNYHYDSTTSGYGSIGDTGLTSAASSSTYHHTKKSFPDDTSSSSEVKPYYAQYLTKNLTTSSDSKDGSSSTTYSNALSNPEGIYSTVNKYTRSSIDLGTTPPSGTIGTGSSSTSPYRSNTSYSTPIDSITSKYTRKYSADNDSDDYKPKYTATSYTTGSGATAIGKTSTITTNGPASPNAGDSKPLIGAFGSSKIATTNNIGTSSSSAYRSSGYN